MDTQSVSCLYLEGSCLHEFIVGLFISSSNDCWGLTVCQAFCSALGECREWNVASDLAERPIWWGRQNTQQQSKTERHDMDGQHTMATQRDLGGAAGVRDLRPWRSRLISKRTPQVQQDSASRREGAGKAYAEAQSRAINCTDFIYIWPQWIQSLLKVSWDFSDCFMNDLQDTKSSFF